MDFFTGIFKRTNGSIDSELIRRLKSSSSFTKLAQSVVFESDKLLAVTASLTCEVTDESCRSTFIADNLYSTLIPQNVEDAKFIEGCRDEHEVISVLKSTRGNFCGFSLIRASNKLVLFTDKTAIRPLYYAITDKYVIFSSQQHEVVNLIGEDVAIDNDALLETLTIGYALGDKTLYAPINRLNVAEILIIDDLGISSKQYWDRSKIAVKAYENIEREVFRKFEEAVAIRLNEDEPTCFLSGGLDSRVIATQLKQNREVVYSFNYGTHHSQDNEFAQRLATSLKLHHSEEILQQLHFPNWSMLISNSLKNKHKNDVPRKVWSGDGGSVCIGATYMTEKIQNAVRDGDIAKALNLFMQDQLLSPPVNFLKSKYQNYDYFLDLLTRNYSENYGERGFYNFLIENDQKRHLDKHFETMLDHKVDLILPFFDSDLLDLLYTIPTSELLYHRLYSRWFELFPIEARRTPWQTYPGHQPCPLELDDSLDYQWKKKKNFDSTTEDLKIYKRFKTSLFFSNFDKKKLTIAMFLHKLKIRNYGYLITAFSRIK